MLKAEKRANREREKAAERATKDAAKGKEKDRKGKERAEKLTAKAKAAIERKAARADAKMRGIPYVPSPTKKSAPAPVHVPAVKLPPKKCARTGCRFVRPPPISALSIFRHYGTCRIWSARGH